MPSPPDDSRFLVPRSPDQPAGSHGEPRGEEFDLSQLDKPAEQGATASKWNRAWVILAGLLTAYCFYFWVYGLGVRAQRPLPLGPITAKSAAVSAVRVHVAGAVKKPGVYAVSADARVFDALQKAGGALPNANADALNLAAFVEDGTKIEVPLKIAPTPQAAPTPVVIVREVPVPAPASSSPLSAAPATSFGESPSASSGKATAIPAEPKRKDEGELKRHPVNLNTASLEELQRLPGVGPKMAERILAYRQENGRFKSVSDLDSVKGIGEKKMEKLGPLVVVK